MGNAVSAQAKKKQRWDWEFKNGRAQVKPRARPAAPKRPLLLRRPSNNYKFSLWYDSNADENVPVRGLARRSSSSRRRR